MKKIVIPFVLLFMSILFLGACKKYEPIYDQEFHELNLVKDIYYIENDNLWVTDKYFNERKKISDTNLGFSKKIKLTFNGLSFAYINQQNQVVARNISNLGVFLTTQAYPNITDFCWAKNNSTLVVLANNTAYRHGTAMNIVTTPYVFSQNAYDKKVTSVALDSFGAQYFTYEYKSPRTGGYFQYSGIIVYRGGQGNILLHNSAINKPDKRFYDLRTDEKGLGVLAYYEDEFGNVKTYYIKSSDLSYSQSYTYIEGTTLRNSVIKGNEITVPIEHKKMRTIFLEFYPLQHLDNYFENANSSIIPMDRR